MSINNVSNSSSKNVIIQFSLGQKTIEKSFLYQTSLYELYVFCAKEFKCGIFIILYETLNLNYLDKNAPLSSIIKNNRSKIVKMKILPKKQKMNQTKNYLECSNNKNKSISLSKGEGSNIFLSSNLNKNKIFTLNLESNENKDEFYLFNFFLEDKSLEKLEVSVSMINYFNEFYSNLSSHPYQKIKELKITSNYSTLKEIIKNYQKVKFFQFGNCRILKLKNVNISFEYPFEEVEVLSLKNSFGFDKPPMLKMFTSLRNVKLHYNTIDDLFFAMNWLSKEVNNLDILKIKYDSIDLDNEVNLNKLLEHPLLSSAKEIFINLKSRLILDDEKKNQKIIDKNLAKIKELKICSYSYFTEKELSFFKGKLTNVKLIKITNHNIENDEIFNNFFVDFPKLEYINIGTIKKSYNFLNKLYKIKSFDSEFLSEPYFSNLSFEKIEKISLANIDFSKKKQELIVRGDIIPTNVNENFYMLIKKIFFSMLKFKKVIIQNFKVENEIFLNNILLNFVNLISSPKIEKIILNKMFINQKILDKLSFIFLNSSSYLRSIEINNINIDDDDLEYLFFSILFQVDYLNLEKILFKNINFSEVIGMVIKEVNFLNLVNIISFDSVKNFEFGLEIFQEFLFKGIELKNVDINAENLEKILLKNINNLEYLSLDLNLKVFDILNKDAFKFPNLKVLKINQGFEGCTDLHKYDFLNKRCLYLKELKKLKLILKTPNKDKKKKICQLYKYLTQF